MKDIARFLAEDLNTKGDITSDALFTSEKTSGEIIAKESGIVAGLAEVEKVFRFVHCSVTLCVRDGSYVKKGCVVARVSGSVRSLLKAERLALNILGRMSGIASATHELVTHVRKINPNVQIAATRKTTPGFRYYEKQAVILGGGFSHRQGLYDALLIKDNHLKIAGSVQDALKKMKKKYPKKPVEIEVENLSEALKAAQCGADEIMLDNFTPKKACEVAEKIRNINPKIVIEVSGGINHKNILKYASFADRISLGCLTHSVKNKDFSFELQRNKKAR